MNSLILDGAQTALKFAESNFTSLCSNFNSTIENTNTAFAITVTSAKTGTRLSRAFLSFAKAGFYSPSFYLNCASSLLSGTSLTLKTASMLTSSACPATALSFWGLSTMCSCAADTLDGCASVTSIIL